MNGKKFQIGIVVYYKVCANIFYFLKKVRLANSKGAKPNFLFSD